MTFANKALEYGNEFDTVWYGKVCSCALAFSFVSMLPGGAITEC